MWSFHIDTSTPYFDFIIRIHDCKYLFESLDHIGFTVSTSFNIHFYRVQQDMFCLEFGAARLEKYFNLTEDQSERIL